jgi:hypothetical protein
MIPEQHSAHEPPKFGRRVVDHAIALAALFISLCSLGLAMHHAHSMRQLVEANSRPFLQFITSNGEERGKGDYARVLTVTVSNPGAGAARVEDFAILVDGRRVTAWPEALALLDPRATPGALGDMTYADVAPSYLKAGSEVLVLRWPRTEANAALWDALVDQGRRRVEFEACYCSIFDDCWREKSRVFRPTPVRSCHK